MNCDLSSVKCVVINLPRAKARLRAIAGQFNQLNTDFETLEATDWRDLNELDYEHVDREAPRQRGTTCALARNDRLPPESSKGDSGSNAAAGLI